MKRLGILLAVVCVFFFFACDKEKELVEVKDDIINVPLNETIEFKYKINGDHTFEGITIEDETIAKYEYKKITGLKEGYTNLYFTIDGLIQYSIPVVVYDKQKEYNLLNPTSPERNYKRLCDLEEKINAFKTTLELSEYITVEEVQVGYMGTQKITHKFYSPQNYYETSQDGHIQLFRNEGENRILYNIYNEQITREYQWLWINNGRETIYSVLKGVFELNLDEKPMALSKDIFGRYTIKVYYKNIYTVDGQPMFDVFRIDELLQNGPKNLNNSVITLEYKISKNKMGFKISSVIEDDAGKPIEISTLFKITNDKFTPIDPLNGDYKIPAPQSIEEVYMTSPLNQKLVVEKGKVFFRFELKKGKLVLDDSNISLKSSYYKLYDKSKKVVYNQFTTENDINYFEISQDGVYYVEVGSMFNSGYIQFSNINE